MAITPQTVLCIPGVWNKRSEIVLTIAEDGYLFAGNILMATDTQERFALDICERDTELKTAFSYAGRGRLTDSDLDAIGSHTFVLYLLADGGSVKVAQSLMHAANSLLKCGGMAVKVDSAGTAHSADQWTRMCGSNDLDALRSAYVTYFGGEGHYYSCGMYNLGYPDAIVEGEIPPDDAARLLHSFVGYLLFENPELNDGETFSIDPDAPRYRLVHRPCTMFEPEDLFHNPFGVWKLVPASLRR